MKRRAFNRACGGLLACALSSASAGIASGRTEAASGSSRSGSRVDGDDVSKPWPRSRLVHPDGTPLVAADIDAGSAWIFHYPFVSTPCFLVRPTDPTATELLAFSAICSHKLSHPSRPVSHVAYRAEPVRFVTKGGEIRERGDVISCCSERSVYDATDDARVLAGPAPMPLARIRLATDADGIRAVASQGPDRYARFLDAFGFRLALEHGITDVRAHARGTTTAVPAEAYSRQQIFC